MSEKTAKEGKGKKTFKTVIIIIIIVLAISGGAFGGYMLVNKNNSQASGNNMQVVNNNVPQQMTSTQTSVNGAIQPVISEFTFELGEFLVNLSDEGEKRFVKANIYIGYSNKKLAKELEGKTPMLRDAINSVLRAKKAKDFTPKGTEDIKLEILNRINPMFKEGRCESIYFNEILVQ